MSVSLWPVSCISWCNFQSCRNAQIVRQLDFRSFCWFEIWDFRQTKVKHINRFFFSSRESATRPLNGQRILVAHKDHMIFFVNQSPKNDLNQVLSSFFEKGKLQSCNKVLTTLFYEVWNGAPRAASRWKHPISLPVDVKRNWERNSQHGTTNQEVRKGFNNVLYLYKITSFICFHWEWMDDKIESFNPTSLFPNISFPIYFLAAGHSGKQSRTVALSLRWPIHLQDLEGDS